MSTVFGVPGSTGSLFHFVLDLLFYIFYPYKITYLRVSMGFEGGGGAGNIQILILVGKEWPLLRENMSIFGLDIL